MVLNSIVMLVQTVLVHLIQVKYSKENTCRDTWEKKRLQFRILKLSVLMLRTTFFWLKGSVPGPKKSLVTIKEAVKAN